MALTRKFGFQLLCLAIYASPAIAKGVKDEYRPSKFFKVGYSEKRLSENSWSVVAQSRERDVGRAFELALYRSAILANSAKQRYIKVFDGDILVIKINYAMAVQTATLKFSSSSSSEDDNTPYCQAKKRFIYLCKQYAVAQIIADLQDVLQRTPEQRSNDLIVSAY